MFVPQVRRIEQQFGRERVKKSYTVPYDSRWKYQWSLVSNVYLIIV